MSRLDKLKRQAINEANQRVLGEDVFSQRSRLPGSEEIFRRNLNQYGPVRIKKKRK
jgi:hypothetical protein